MTPLRAAHVVAVALLGSGTALAQRPVPDLVKKVMDSYDKVKFLGVRTLQFRDKDGPRLVTERVIRDGRKMRIEVLDGATKGFVIVDDGMTRHAFDPRTNEIREVPSREREFVARIRGAFARGRRKGEHTEEEGGPVAGIKTRVLEVKDPGGSLLKVWIDPAEGNVLKFQTFDRQGGQNAFFEYTRVDYNAKIPADAFTINKPGARVVTAEDDLRRFEREFGMRPFRILPIQGWKLASARKLEPGNAKVVMQTYLTPKGPVSLFQVRGEVLEERLRRAAGERARARSWKAGGVTLVLVGNLTDEELERISNRVKD
ncbi:MAG: hypothetical protein KIT11_08755 [Fimbriimonadaceae bacterium]|nr:hypothetical protein [Fimbriimonadaceae bacterium]QYK55416.1 MAG: hypothetical protein KF733_10425 [Fimbriimonadaceae bacterium]